MLKIFKPISDLTKSFGGIVEGARGFLERASAGGLKGVVQDAFDFNAGGFREEADRRMGRIVMHLTMAGDTEAVEVALRFRNYAIGVIDELERLRKISDGFDTDDLDKIGLMVDRMAEYLDANEGQVTCSDREEALQQEIARLKQINRRLSLFIESEEAFLAGEEKASDCPAYDAPREAPPAALPAAGKPVNRSPRGYPVAGGARKKPPAAGGRQPGKA